MGLHRFLKKAPNPGLSHYLNQDVAIKLEANAFTEPGTPYSKADSSR